jgi:hypothetical protein
MLYAKGKKVEFTFHARRRMSERRLTEDEIVKVLESPDTEGRARSKGCRRAERKFGTRTLGVVYQEKVPDDVIKIITVW